MFKIVIDKERCKGCSLCISVCPKELIKATSLFNKKGYGVVEIEKREECLGCQQCAIVCPEGAIEIFKDE